MRRGRFPGPWSILPVVLCSAPLLAAQINTGEISGVVRDGQGGVLPGASVVAEHVESRTRTSRFTDGQGRFLLPSLRVGTYILTTELSGFRRVVRSAITLELGQQLQMDLVLEVGGVTEEVTVTGQTLLQSATAEISDVIDNIQVVQIPLNGRNFLVLAQLSDGVVLPPGGTRGEALNQAGPLPNVGGQRSGHTSISLTV
jgi:Carboxypeptidase regulatory-like domain